MQNKRDERAPTLRIVISHASGAGITPEQRAALEQQPASYLTPAK